MKKIILISIFILFICSIFWGTPKIVPLNDSIMKPDQIVVSDKYIYITEGTTISIFSIKDYKFISKFGTKGEGPGEIQGSRRGNIRFTLIPLENQLYLFNRNKVMYFTEMGKFLNEKRFQGGFVRNFLPIGDKYVGMSFTGFGRGRRNRNDIKSSINIFTKELKKSTAFYGEGKNAGFASFLKHYSPENIFILKTDKNKIYITDSMKLNIKTFDVNGKKLKEINYKYINGNVPTSRTEEINNYYKNSPRFKAFYDRIKNRISVGKVYPAIKDLFIDKEMILVQTYKDTENGTEFYIFNKSGKFLKKTVLSIKKLNVIDFYPFSIRNGKLYQIVENEDEEEWELHVSKI